MYVPVESDNESGTLVYERAISSNETGMEERG